MVIFLDSNSPIRYHRLNQTFPQVKKLLIPFSWKVTLKMHDLKVPMQYDVHTLNEVDKMNIFLEVILHETRHVKECKILQFDEIYLFDMIIQKGLQNQQGFGGNETPQNHLPQISQYFCL